MLLRKTLLLFLENSNNTLVNNLNQSNYCVFLEQLERRILSTTVPGANAPAIKFMLSFTSLSFLHSYSSASGILKSIF